MPVILIVMVSKHYENNFQPVSMEKWGRFYRKKDDWKFSVFRRTCFYGIKLLPAESPILRRIQIYTFYPSSMNWPGSRIQNIPMIDDNSVTLRYSKFLRNVSTLFYLIIFYYFYLSLSTYICLYLLQWLLYPNYTFPTPNYTFLMLWW